MIERSVEKMWQVTQHPNSMIKQDYMTMKNDTKSCNAMMDVAWQCISERLYKCRGR